MFIQVNLQGCYSAALPCFYCQGVFRLRVDDIKCKNSPPVTVYRNIAYRNSPQECDILYPIGLYLWVNPAQWYTELTASMIAACSLTPFHVYFSLKAGAGDQQHQFKVTSGRGSQQWIADKDQGVPGQTSQYRHKILFTLIIAPFYIQSNSMFRLWNSILEGTSVNYSPNETLVWQKIY